MLDAHVTKSMIGLVPSGNAGCSTHDNASPIRVDKIMRPKHSTFMGTWYLLPTCLVGIENGDLNKTSGVSLGCAIRSKKASME
jgi:hypothetical protein